MQLYRTIRSRSCAVTILFAAVLFCIGNPVIQAQTQEVPSAATPSFLRYGLFGGVSISNHAANFSEFTGFSNYVGNSFGNANGIISYSIGGLIEVPVVERFGVALRAGFANLGDFTLTVPENLLAPSVEVLAISNMLTVKSLQLLSGEPYLTYHILDGLTFYVGARFGYLMSQGFHFEERLVDTSKYMFIDQGGTRSPTRNNQNGDIPQFNPLNIALSGGVSMEIPIDASKHWFLAAEAFYMHGLTQVANGLVLRRPVATFNGLSATRTVPQNELGTVLDPASASWPRETSTGSWLFNNIRAGISLRYAP